MPEVSLDKIVQLVVQEVVDELTRRGVTIVTTGRTTAIGTDEAAQVSLRTKVERIDMSGYRTPILTEAHIQRLHELTGEIIIPEGTIMTPKAREAVRARRVTIRFE